MSSGNWQDSLRRKGLPDDWFKRVAQVKKRAGRRCELRMHNGRQCPKEGTEVDHAIAPDYHELDGLQLLCYKHHQDKTQREAAAGKAAKKDRAKRPAEDHPGNRPAPAHPWRAAG